MRLPRRYEGVVRPIVTYDSDPVLHRPCAPVTVFDESLRRLVLDMFASMEAADGVGLAANQIGVDARVFVIDCPDAEGRDVVGYAVNPVLTVLDPVGDEPAEEVTEEGCLSVPGPYADLARAFRARVDGVDVNGAPVSIEATGHGRTVPAARGRPPGGRGLRRPAAGRPARAAAGGGGRPRGGAARVTVTVVGIGADGWAGLAEASRAAVRDADVVLGGPRQLAMVAPHTAAEPVAWPTPMVPALAGLFADLDGRVVCALASGDPMCFGVGATLARVLGPQRLRVLPHPSAVALACARLGWPSDDVTVVSAVGRPLAAVRRVRADGQRVLVLSAGADTPREVAALLAAEGWGASMLTVLEQLGGPGERRVEGTAAGWAHPPGDPLNVVAVRCIAGPAAVRYGETAGLPDTAYDHDGQLTKREVRAVTLALLAPARGSCSGTSVPAAARSASSGCARTRRAGPWPSNRIRRAWLGSGPTPTRWACPACRWSRAARPLRSPDCRPPTPCSSVAACGGVRRLLGRVAPGGRLVANAVTVEAETLLAGAHAEHGGELVRLSVARAAPLGGFTGWRPAMPVTIWSAAKAGQ